MGPMGTADVWKNSGRLADGREIIYFDESPGLGRADVPDLRPLTSDSSTSVAPGTGLPAPGWPESGLRWDALRGEWVVIAAQRQDRTFLPPADECPLCPSRPGRLTEIPADNYDVVVFENRFPSLRGTADGSSCGPPGSGPAETAGVPGRPALGRCEVVCFTSDHDASFASLTPRRVRTVVEAWADRTTTLGAMAGIEQVYCFENRGEEIGVTLRHPHGQIYGFPFVTPMTSRMVAQARGYTAGTGRNLFDDLVAGEIATGIRLVARNEHWTAFVPAAARWPYEVLLFPAVRVADIPALSEEARAAFCDLYLDVLNRLDALFGMPLPYIAAWHQAPNGDEFARSEFGLHLQVLSVQRAPGKLKYLAGTESGMGVWINDVLPEEAALRLREAR
ncbi:MAG: UDPglucose--hexose-phosphate uridylyltransferase [Streptosporangiaceae bacterium]|jgi:UDPglucose--hexose-1-phosphate uridylyltransferase|nr:UDPglucose--hexose-phosphate uridylyltransferase [Streptosporangiaceae bacterium]